MIEISIKKLIYKKFFFLNKTVIIKGWIKYFRNNKFLILNDGSTIKNLQIVITDILYKKYKKNIGNYVAVSIIGVVKKQLKYKKEIEIICEKIFFYSSPYNIQKTILQKKTHNLEKVREQLHLRFYTNFFSAVTRIRHYISIFIHNYFHKKNFFYIHTPIITKNNSEGTGDMIKVINNKNNKNNCYLSVSGQLEAEAAALSLGKVYTFGPVFRGENSNTFRHLSEFWMIEPEISFFNLDDIIDFSEKFLKKIIKFIINNCEDDLNFLSKKLEEKKKENLFFRLKNILKNKFLKISYTDSINILKKNNFSISWGEDLQSIHERFLVEKYFKNTLIIYNYPKEIKPFYMFLNNDEKTVRAIDILFPKIGEIIGGSQREDRYDVLLNNFKKKSININKLNWYLETRIFGNLPHSGFGLGFDRLVQFITGMDNIRDVIPFPITPNYFY
ncbi:asparagine--tRNA ligase [Candidatus Shikimatogenerans silvanidophilus]|uniref:asparagine--tRNA ligase n=1 Tax=Candidatus Shikimatogenerans silvanidophilus TaxID=2782547 RepID=UPI001BAA3025|nr:asparagine--tRNA ligase [Candidatus Shikimatogenerans silvanidophilus]